MILENDSYDSNKYPEEYWATLEGSELSEACWKRWKEYHEWLTGSGRLALYRDSADFYYMRDSHGGTTPWASNRRVRRHRENPGVLKLRSNHYGSTARHKITLVTSKPLTFQVFTTNTDTASQAAAAAGRALLEYLKRAKNLERVRKLLAKHAVLYTAGYVSWDWDPDVGPDVPPELIEQGKQEFVLDENGEPQFEEDGTPILAKMPKYGDFVLRNHTPVDVAYDYSAPTPNVSWIILRHFESRYDLIAKNPNLRERILRLNPEKRAEWRLSAYFEGLKNNTCSDLLPVYRLIHKPTPACPEGREAYFLNHDLLLKSGPLDYSEVPYTRCTAEDEDDSPDGHSDQVDQIGLQEAHDAAVSTALSKQQASMPKPFIALQAAITKKDLGGGFQVFVVNGPPKEMVEFVEYDSTAEKDVALANYFQGQIEVNTSINPILRGDTEAVVSGASGRAVAFMQAQAAIGNWGLEGSLRDAMGAIGMGSIDTYQRKHTAQQQLIIITGKVQESQTINFTGSKDLEGVRAVTVEQGDPITGTPSGRLELLGLLKDELQVQGIDFNKAYQIITEGRWEPAIEDLSAIDQQVRTENELLAKGVQIQPLSTEHHLKHVLGHLALANRPGLPVEVAGNVLLHVRMHVYEWRMSDPAILAAMGIPPAPPDPLLMPEQYAQQQALMMGAEGEGSAMPAPPGQPQAGGKNSYPGGAQPPDGQPTAEDQQPGMPTLPNGNEADPTNQGAPPFPQI